jgi:cytidine deaminase
MTTITAAQHTNIKQLVLQYGGYLPVQVVQQLLSATECTIDQFLLALLPLASEFAVMPVCGFMVGAVALGDTGNLYIGSSQDFGKMSLSQAVHAEQAALAMAQLHGETGLSKIAINARPCGFCRQFLFELANGSELEIMLQDAPPIKLSKLLPHAFGPQHLQVEGGVLLPQQHSLKLLQSTNEELSTTALRGAIKSYAPYTKAYSGAALKTDDGKFFMGSYLENAAFNPALPALQSALVKLVQCGYRYENVMDAALVQVKDNVIDQVAATRMVLKSVCPEVHLQVYEAL